MALETNPDQAFLAPPSDDDFAALDSMAFTGTRSQFNTNNMTPNDGGNFGGASDNNLIGRVSDGREAGFTGVSESLFDRIRARTAEQQTQPPSNLSSQATTQPQPLNEPTHSSQQVAPLSQQPDSEPTMEIENKNTFDAAVVGASTGSPFNNQHNTVNNNETTYAFAATAGENFSAASPYVPQYGPSRNDPYYAASSSGQPQQYPTSIQDKATMALAQTSDTVKSIFGAGLNGAQAIGALAQEKMAGRGSSGQGERSYNNNFLMREDSMEQGAPSTMDQRPPPAAAPAGVTSGSQVGAVSGQAYSMLSYGKTFFEDLFVFVMQLPLWGKGIVVLVLSYVLYLIIDFI